MNHQYVIIAYDGTDDNALERRMAVRPEHLEKVRKMKAAGEFIEGGAILDDNGKMIGSVMILAFNNQAEFDNWYSSEPYITEKVWQKIEVRPFRCAIL